MIESRSYVRSNTISRSAGDNEEVVSGNAPKIRPIAARERVPRLPGAVRKRRGRQITVVTSWSALYSAVQDRSAKQTCLVPDMRVGVIMRGRCEIAVVSCLCSAEAFRPDQLLRRLQDVGHDLGFFRTSPAPSTWTPFVDSAGVTGVGSIFAFFRTRPASSV